MVIRIVCTVEGDHHSCCSLQCSLYTERTGSNRFFLVCRREHSGRTTLVDIEFDGANFYAKAVFHEVFQIFSGACQHFMSECVYAYITCKLADKLTVSIINSFGNADNQVGSMLESFLNICKELFLIKCNFRKIDQNRIVAFEFTGKDTGSGQPSGMTAHDLNDCNGFFIIINRSVDRNLTNSGCYIFGSTSESRCMVCQDKVIVDRLRDSNETDLAVYSLSIAGKLAYCIHGIISTDVEEVADIVLLKFLKELRIDSVCQVFRKFVTAGTKIRSRCCLDQFKFTVHF